jgi:transcriptional regulator with XRE-family HTH domain
MLASDDKMNAFGQWLVRELENRGWSQAELARRAHVSRTAISDVISSRRGAGPDLLKAIAEGFNLPKRQVFEAAGILPPDPEDDPTTAEVNYLLTLLPQEDREEILELISVKLTRTKKFRHNQGVAPAKQV